MAIRNVLVHVDSGSRSSTTVKVAATVARKFNARLSGFSVIPDVAAAAAVPGGATMSTQIIEDMREDAEQRAAAARKIFYDAAGELAESGWWSQPDAIGIGSRAAAAKAAYYTDLLVAGGAGDDDRGSIVHIQDLVLDSGRPLLYVPRTKNTDMKTRRVLIAWSESREAARTVFDSLPFLAIADSIDAVIVANGEDSAPATGEKIAAILRDHGLQVSVRTVARKDGQSTSEALFDYAGQIDADLLVAGAYSHSRLREGLFGGVTKSIFDSAPLPVLLSH